MNRIYRRIWNATRRCWVVASELSSPRGKPAQTRVLMSALLLTAAGGALAANDTDELEVASESSAGTLHVQKELISLISFAAPNSLASAMAPRGRYDQLAIVMSGNYADAQVSGADVLALGSQAKIYGTESTGLGNYAEARGGYATAVGHFAKASGGYGTALGTKAHANGWGATALGHDSQASADNAVAIGSGARSLYTNSIALGANSYVYASNTVSVGDRGSERRITNVAGGTGGTDAVNVNQLDPVRSTANTARNTANTAQSTANAAQTKANTAQTAANTAQNTANTAQTKANTAQSTANTAQTTANTAQTKATTAQTAANTAQTTANTAQTKAEATATQLSSATLAIGQSANASATYGTAVGGNASAGDYAVAVGNQAQAKEMYSTALGRSANAGSRGTTALGNSSNAGGSGSTAVGYIAKSAGTNAVSVGYDAKGAGAYSTALGASASATHGRSVALGSGSETTGTDQVSVGNATVQRKVVNMADGLVASGSMEAVTGNQLFETHATATNAKTAADAALGQVKASTYLTAHGVAGNDTNKAQATGAGALATGIYTEATGSSALAMGNSAKALANNAIALGAGASARHTGSIALGSGSQTTAEDQVSVGSASKGRRIVNVAKGDVSDTSSEAVTGAQLFATDEMARGAETLAQGAATAADNAVAKVTVLEGLVREDAPAGSVRLGGNNSGSVLDVRNKSDGKRKITGVAEGALVAGSADAVTGGQLATTNANVAGAEKLIADVEARLEAGSRRIAVGGPVDDERAQAGRLGIAIGDSAFAAPTKDAAVALGSYSRAEAEDSVALGRAAWVQESASLGFALGSRSVVEEAGGLALGASSSVSKGAQNAVAVGYGSMATESSTVSFGDGILQRRLTNLARGTADHNATTVGQLNDTLATLGGGAKLNPAGNVTAPTYTVQNTRQHTVGDALNILDGAVLRTTSRMDGVEGELRSIFQERVGVQSNGIGTLGLAGINGALLTNLADGRIAAGSRDAVTGNQLFAAEQRIERNRSELDALQRDGGSEQLRAFAGSRVGNPIDFGGARLTGVADARLSVDSSDVVRGSQLYDTNIRLKSVEDLNRDIAFGWVPEDWRDRAVAGPAGVAIGRGATASVQSEGGVAVGSWASANGKNSVALGRAAHVHEDAYGGFSLGVFSSVMETGGVALGVDSSVEKGAEYAVALGQGSIAVEQRTVSIGSTGLARRITNVASGTASHNAATVGQLRSALVAIGSEVDANGNIVGPQFNVQGGTQSTVNDALTSLDGAVISTTSRVANVEGQLRSIFQDTPSTRADGFNQLTLAGAQGMVISNVANGLVAAGSREAVNGGQLHAVQQQLNGRIDGLEQRVEGQGPAPQSRAMPLASTEQEAAAPTPPVSGDDKLVADTGNAPKSSPAPQPKAEAPESPKSQVDTAELEKMLARANDYSDGIAREVDARLNKMDKRFNRMAAMSSAQTAMAMNTAGLATYNRLGAGVGYAEGESAMAVGYQRVLNEKGSATFSLNGAFTNSGERSMGVGVGIGW